MAERERLELLCSRELDGEITPAEKAYLREALERDAGLREFREDLQRTHEDLRRLAQTRLPAEFPARVAAGIDAAPVVRLGWREFAAAAAVLLAFAVLVGASVIRTPGRPADAPAEAPIARLSAFSEGQIELLLAEGTRHASDFDANVTMPAEIRAPRDAHAVVYAGGGTAILSPGARARLADADLDGVANVEPVEGDIYLEGPGPIFTRLGEHDVRVRGGMTVRPNPGGFELEPSHGRVGIGGQWFSHGACATISNGHVSLRDCEDARLDDWAIRGRVDAIKRQVRVIAGDRLDKVPEEIWQRSEKLLYGVLSRPSMAASNAYMIRFLLKHGFFEDFSDDEREAWAAIADIVAEGTTESDVPVKVVEMFQHWETHLRENPETVDDIRALVRHWMERTAGNATDTD